MDDLHYDYDQSSYDIGSHLMMNLSGLEHDQFCNEWGDPVKRELVTSHSDKPNPKENGQPPPSSEDFQLSYKPTRPSLREASVIETKIPTLFRIQKTKKGRPKEIKNLDQIFKNEMLNFLKMLADFKVLDKSAEFQINRFKQEKAISKCFSDISKCPQINQKIREYYHSPAFVKRLMMSVRLLPQRKIEVIKNLRFFQRLFDI